MKKNTSKKYNFIKALGITISSAFLLFTPILAKSKIQNLTSRTNKKYKTLDQELEDPTKNTVKDESIFNTFNSKEDLKKHQIGIGLGQTFPFNDFDKYGDSEITIDMYYGYSASYSFDLLINAHYSRLETKDNKSVELMGTNLSIKGKLVQFDAFAPYFLAGLGFYHPRVLINDISVSPSKLVFGINAGVGGELKLNEKVKIGVLLHYHDPFDIKPELNNDKSANGSYFKLLITAFYTI